MLEIVIDYLNSQWGTISKSPSFFIINLILGFALGWFSKTLFIRESRNALEISKQNLKSEINKLGSEVHSLKKQLRDRDNPSKQEKKVDSSGLSLEQRSKDNELESFLNTYLEDSFKYSDKEAEAFLQKYIENASEIAIKKVFDIARQIRKESRTRNNSSSKNRDSRTNKITKKALKRILKVIPIFDILINTNPEFHRNYAQKAYAIKTILSSKTETRYSINPPRHWREILRLLDQAIAKRKLINNGNLYPLYELNRAITMINLDDRFLKQEISDDYTKNIIISDLKYFLRGEKREISTEDYNKIIEWCILNEERSLVKKIKSFRIELY